VDVLGLVIAVVALAAVHQCLLDISAGVLGDLVQQCDA
jgi:hypothetical protein